MTEKFVTVARFADYMRADLARQVLESAGIKVVVTGQNVGNIYAGLAGIADVELQTPESQAAEAREILEADRRQGEDSERHPDEDLEWGDDEDFEQE
jgi:hypothetical protein